MRPASLKLAMVLPAPPAAWNTLSAATGALALSAMASGGVLVNTGAWLLAVMVRLTIAAADWARPSLVA